MHGGESAMDGRGGHLMVMVVVVVIFVHVMVMRMVVAITAHNQGWCDGHHAYLIFVIFFTLAKFLENKIYTEKRQFFALNL